MSNKRFLGSQSWVTLKTGSLVKVHGDIIKDTGYITDAAKPNRLFLADEPRTPRAVHHLKLSC